MKALAILAGFSLFIAWTLPRAIHYARREPFTIGVQLYRKPRIEFRGVSAVFPTEAGQLELQASRAHPGHRNVGLFKLGPSTHFDLENSAVSLVEDGVRRWTLRAQGARLGSSSIDLRHGPVDLRQGEEFQSFERATVDLNLGTWKGR